MPLSSFKIVLRLLALTLFVTQSVEVAFAQGKARPLLLPLGETQSAKLSSLVEGEGSFTLEDGEANYSAGQWVRWGHPKSPAPRARIVCRDGSVIVARADWSTKPPISLANGTLQLEHTLFEQINVPSHHVELWLLGAAKEPFLARTIAAEHHANPTVGEDRVWLMSGDSFSGKALSFDGTLRFEATGQEIELAAADVAAVAFAPRSGSEATSPPKYWFGLEDGTLVAAVTLTLLPERIVASTPGGVELLGRRSPLLIYVQSLDGIAYLSDAKPLDYRHTPYYDISWPMESDRNLERKAPCAGRLHYQKCLAMHTAARAVYEVPAGATHFAAEVAIDDSSGEQGSATFRVYRVVEQRPELAFESRVIRGGDSPQSLNVSLERASVIILVVDYADFGDERDHCLWLDPRWVIGSRPN